MMMKKMADAFSPAERHSFIVEEYKNCQAFALYHNQAARRLEYYVLGGSIAVYATLLRLIPSAIAHVAPFIWWTMFVIICISCARCAGHYTAVRFYAQYMLQIEARIYRDDEMLSGFEHYCQTKIVRPWAAQLVHGAAWLALLSISLFLGINGTIPSHPISFLN